jgi:hypothetical protein
MKLAMTVSLSPNSLPQAGLRKGRCLRQDRPQGERLAASPLRGSAAGYPPASSLRGKRDIGSLREFHFNRPDDSYGMEP